MNVLFVSSTRVGDAILSTGLLERILTDHPDAWITVACGPAAAPLFERVPNLQRIIVLDKMLFSLHWLRLWLLCIGTFWDLIIDLRNAPVTYLLLHKKRKGMAKSREAERRVEMITRVLDLPEVAAPKLWTGEEEEQAAKQLIPDGSPVLAVGPTANWRAKTWRSEYFVELIAELTGDKGILPGARVAIFGRDDERPIGKSAQSCEIKQ
jgi:heptosyltransferase-3